jgi:hypothetical protein
MQIEVADEHSVFINVSGYRIKIHAEDHKVVITALGPNESQHEMTLDHVVDSKNKPRPNSVPLDRKLTLENMPADFATKKRIRLVVWELVDGARTILDICEGTPRQVANMFNYFRKNRWPHCCEAALEVVEDQRKFALTPL